MEPGMFRIICGVLAAVLLGLIVMRRRGRESSD
jgi:MYXO-CTERM domain-containing protein